jgi:hypothetical protein
MTAFTGSTDCSPARLAVTRDGLHQVAEHVLTAGLYAASGEIGLIPIARRLPDPPFGPDGRFLAVDGTELVVGGATTTTTRRTVLTTPRAAADVGPHGGPPPGDPAFWNAPFGAARTFGQIGTVAEAAAFFRDARARALTHAGRTP